MIDSFHIAVALIPLATYFLVIGVIRLQNRPMLTTGGREIAALAFALIGFAAIGPMELFFPRAAVMWLGPKVWLMLSILYALCVLLVILNSRPRIVVYGLNGEELVEIALRVFQRIDPKAQWLGNQVLSTDLGIQATVETAGPGRVSHVVCAGRFQDFEGWLRLERELAIELREVRISTRPAGQLFLMASLILFAVAGFSLLKDPQATAQAMRLMLRR